MARGGRGRRTYARDARGRFASSPGGGVKPKPRRGALKPGGGTAKARGSLGRSRAKLAAKDPADRSLSGALSRRSQKGAVTRGERALAQARKEARVRLNIGPKKGTIRRPKGRRGAPDPAISLAARKLENAVSKGVRTRTTEADERQRRQALMAAETKLARLIESPPRNSFAGPAWGRMQIEQQQRFIESLRKPLPPTRPVDRGAIKEAAKKEHLRKRLEKRDRKFRKSLETAARAGAYYRKTGTLPASMRKKKARRRKSK